MKIIVKCAQRLEFMGPDGPAWSYRFTSGISIRDGAPVAVDISMESRDPQHFKVGRQYELLMTASGIVPAGPVEIAKLHNKGGAA